MLFQGRGKSSLGSISAAQTALPSRQQTGSHTRKHTALARRTLHQHLATMLFHNHLDGGKTQSLSTGATSRCVGPLIETLKDALLLIQRNTTARITYLQDHYIPVFVGATL